MPVYKIHHITRYEYDRPIRESTNEIKLYPFICREQETLQHDITVTDAPKVETYMDYWGNKTGTFNVLAPHRFLNIESRLIIRTTLSNQLHVNFHTGFTDLAKDMENQLLFFDLAAPDVIKGAAVIKEIISPPLSSGKSVAATVEYFAEYVFKHFKYIKDVTSIDTTVDQILEQKAGVCQDFAHVLLQLLRTAGIPSRYVSGYICPNKNGMRGEGATHAWVEAWIPQYIWVTNTHVKLATGRHFKDCTPVKGTFKGPARQTLSLYVSVGYEDGHIFEESNNVKMSVQPSAAQEEPVVEGLAGQQQQ
jgi:transglutaminase-like putative cysteine protease